MKRKALKAAWYTGLITAGLVLADQIFGGQSLSEMYNLLAHAAPNGDPIGSTLSLMVDNAYRVSLPGAAAAGAGAVTTYKTLEGLIGDDKPKAEKAAETK